jgi:Small, acid-soluble spore proteins, alpha/beta type.
MDNMAVKKDKPIRLEELTKEELVKYEIAEELGLLDRVLSDGWRSLSSKETGRIGGLLARRKRELEKK